MSAVFLITRESIGAISVATEAQFAVFRQVFTTVDSCVGPAVAVTASNDPFAPVITPISDKYPQRERLSAFNDPFSSHCDNIPDADRIKAM